jgi:hypothetical protein
VVERAIELTTQDFRVQEGLRTRERQAELVARDGPLPDSMYHRPRPPFASSMSEAW